MGIKGMLRLLLISVFVRFDAVRGKVFDPETQYDPVWLASLSKYPPVQVVNRTNNPTPYITNVDVEFRLFTRRNRLEYQLLEIDNTTLLWSSNFNKYKPVKILAHGWYNHGDSPMPQSLKEAYLTAGDLNVIVIDWDKAANVNYISASYNVAEVGHRLTMFLNFLIREGVSPDDVHMIGHSLGAHVVGIAGAFVEKGPIHTITGLDPALPLFTEGNRDARLDRHDAQYVEVIHTCAGYLGFSKPIGHVDFYPNGGRSQPGCGTDYRGFCAHNRAHRFFSESLQSDTPFVGVRCEKYDGVTSGCCTPTGETLNMGGFNVNYGEEGVYYVKTNSEPPFAKGPKKKCTTKWFFFTYCN